MELRLKASAVEEICLSCKDDADPELAEYFLRITAAAAAICDNSPTEEDALSFYAQEPTETYDSGSNFVHISETNHIHCIYYFQYDDVSQTQYSIYLRHESLEHDSNGNLYTDLDLLEGPAVENGVFTFAIKNNIDTLINYYLEDCNSSLKIYPDGYSQGPTPYSIYDYGIPLDTDHYRLYLSTKQFFFTLYNINVADIPDLDTSSTLYSDPQAILRIPVALSIICDSGMAEKESMQLHSHTMDIETTTVSGDVITLYCPRDVLHILLENPENGANLYFILTKDVFDNSFGGDVLQILQAIR